MAVVELIGLAIAAYSAYSASNAADKQSNIASNQAEVAAGQLALSREIFDTITRPQFNRASQYLWGYGTVWGTNIIEQVVRCGLSVCDYTINVDVPNRVIATTAAAVNAARRNGLRSVRKGQVGACFDNDFRFAALQAALTVKAVGIAEQFESNKALQWGQFYWARNLNAAQMAHNVIATGANLLVGAGTGIQQALNGMTGITGSTFDAARLSTQAAGNQQSVTSGLGSLAGLLLGGKQGSTSGDRSGLIGSLFGGTSGGGSSGDTGTTPPDSGAFGTTTLGG